MPRRHYRGLSRDVRAFVLIRDGFRCRYCGAGLCEGTFTVDHVTPRHAGGSDRLSNLVAACYACNCAKGGRALADSGLRLRPSPLAVPITTQQVRRRARR